MILVTGASGNLGEAVIEHLSKQVATSKIAGLYRSKEKAKAGVEKGIQVRFGDYADKYSILKALEGVGKVLLISSSSDDALTDHKNVIDAAKELGVAHIYYTSGALNKNVKKTQLGPLVDSYITTEKYLFESGLTYTIFQNGLYAETIPMFVGEAVLKTGVYFPAGDGKATFAKRTEMAEAIAYVLTSDGHDNKVYPLTGLTAYSFHDIALMLSELSGKPVSYDNPEPEEYAATWREYGVGEGDIYISLLLAAVIKNHEYDTSVSALEELLGRKPANLKTYLQETFL